MAKNLDNICDYGRELMAAFDTYLDAFNNLRVAQDYWDYLTYRGYCPPTEQMSDVGHFWLVLVRRSPLQVAFCDLLQQQLDSNQPALVIKAARALCRLVESNGLATDVIKDLQERIKDPVAAEDR